MRNLAVIAVLFSVAVATPSAWAAGPLRVEPNIVFHQGAGDSFVFPVAGSVEGVNGTHFRSDVTLVNFSPEPQEVIVEFLDGTPTPATVRMTLDASSFRIFDDFVTGVMNRPGILGVLRFRAVETGTDTTDTAARVNGYSRIWTPAPGTNGTTSISLPAVSGSGLTSNASAYIIGLRQTNQYRTNIGIVNLENVDRVFEVVPTSTSGADPDAFTVTVPANSLRQINLQAGEWEGVVVRITPTTAGSWTAYGASVDNVTGDGWVSLAEHSTRQ